jgi:hypothetical protein
VYTDSMRVSDLEERAERALRDLVRKYGRGQIDLVTYRHQRASLLDGLAGVHSGPAAAITQVRGLRKP